MVLKYKEGIMRFGFEKPNYFVFYNKSYASDDLIKLARHFSDIKYYEIEKFGILYKTGLQPQTWLKEFAEESISFYEWVIENSKMKLTWDYNGKKDEVDLSEMYGDDVVEKYKEDLKELRNLMEILSE